MSVPMTQLQAALVAQSLKPRDPEALINQEFDAECRTLRYRVRVHNLLFADFERLVIDQEGFREVEGWTTEALPMDDEERFRFRRDDEELLVYAHIDWDYAEAFHTFYTDSPVTAVLLTLAF